ncbi:MAG: DGQHR domain-containing protein [Lachnospiraceae bacterium]|jgi:DNA sulfur modification protein DndB|nr:DGQHR domain-containing protein [Lachnospiraceae bacterium]
MATIGCIRARMGNTPYYLAKMPVGQLIDNVGIAKELPEWPDMSADEKMQREFDIRRVVEEMVPYVVEDPDRFFGSLIIDIYSGYEDIVFESVAEAIPGLPAAYRMPMRDMGFLTLPGKERLIALDGQHRLLALRIGIKGFMGVPAGVKMTPAINKLEPHPELANEEISVILVEHTDTKKIRKIFNKINKYAKQTSRGDNIITSDDDIFAVISRRLISEGEPLAPINGIELVNWKSNTLSLRSKQLTTLSALYTIADTLLKDKKFSAKALPREDEIESAYREVSDFWGILLKNLETFQEYIWLTQNGRTISIMRDSNLLCKPITQMALAHVARMAKSKELPWLSIVEKLNQVDWSFDNELWYNILVIGSANKKMITGKESVRGAGMVISYLVMGDEMAKAEIEDVRTIIRNARNNPKEPLPKRV